jgi:hypothetical protein
MSKRLISEIENVFRISDSSDKLFDYFQLAVENRIDDINLYKIFLANPVLCAEEIALFSEKLIAEFPSLSYSLHMWSAGILETNRYCAASLEKAFEYYKRAMAEMPDSEDPIFSMIGMYNAELDFPPASEIISQIENSSEKIIHKERIFLALADFCKKIKKADLARKYEAMSYLELKKGKRTKNQ